MSETVNLYYREYGDPDQPALIMLHGLLGSLVNWHSIARKLSGEWRLVVPDLRNHGRSPHASEMNYPAMAADVIRLMDTLNLERAVLLGHSMGGKVAMQLALREAGRVSALVSADIAPVDYPPRFEPVLEALLKLPLDQLESRSHADTLLAMYLEEKTLRDYLLQNLQRDGDRWRWRNNLPVLYDNMKEISGFPRSEPAVLYTGPSLFLYGAESNYVKPEYHPLILDYFPMAQIRGIENAGHWLYAEQPSQFLEILQSFLNSL